MTAWWRIMSPTAVRTKEAGVVVDVVRTKEAGVVETSDDVVNPADVVVEVPEETASDVMEKTADVTATSSATGIEFGAVVVPPDDGARAAEPCRKSPVRINRTTQANRQMLRLGPGKMKPVRCISENNGQPCHSFLKRNG